MRGRSVRLRPSPSGSAKAAEPGAPAAAKPRGHSGKKSLGER